MKGWWVALGGHVGDKVTLGGGGTLGTHLGHGEREDGDM